MPEPRTHDTNAVAYLFTNGNAMYFDENGDQIADYQQRNHRGVHGWREDYPDAPVYWAAWDGPRIEIDDAVIEQIESNRTMSEQQETGRDPRSTETKQALEYLRNLEEDWEYLNDEEKFGSAVLARQELERAMEAEA